MVVAALLGSVLAAIAYYLFFTGSWAWLNLIVWAVVAATTGFILRTWRLSILDCAIIGFAIVFTYSILGYQGSSSLLAVLPAFALIALVGALGTTAMGLVGQLVRRRTRTLDR
ncbi:MAG: hypothetical protein ABIO06_00485 [Pseudolysinimonas sp.]